MFDLENDVKPTEPHFILVNNLQTIATGEISGSIIAKVKPRRNYVIFSDKISISPSEIHISGLHVGIRDNKPFTQNRESHFINNLDEIDYVVKLPFDIVRQFDEARFSANYPNIIRFLTSKVLYSDLSENNINLLRFFAGEILNRPIALRKDFGVVISDRVVIDEIEAIPIFYDAIVIQRDENEQLHITYEPLTRYPIDQLSYIILLGVENF